MRHEAHCIVRGFEYANPEFVAANHRLTSYVKHPKHSLVPGSYTDDTQMSIANAEVICTLDFDQAALAQAYVACFKRDQREGYAGGFYRFLVEVKDGAEFLERIKPNSDKSGGASHRPISASLGGSGYELHAVISLPCCTCLRDCQGPL